jgi:hypothetical protein
MKEGGREESVEGRKKERQKKEIENKRQTPFCKIRTTSKSYSE